MTREKLLELCDYLECNDVSLEAQREAAAFIRKALAQPEQEPVAKYTGKTWCGSVVNLYEEIPLDTLLYTTPPQRKPLTDEEIDLLLLHHEMMSQWPKQKQIHAFARAIEAAHGIKE